MTSKKIRHGRYTAVFIVGNKEVTATWDTKLRQGRLIWVDGSAWELTLPRDRNLARKILLKGERGPNINAN